MEALRLAIYFEETGAYNYRRNREMASQSGSSANESVETIPDDEEDEE